MRKPKSEFYNLSERLLNSGDACWGNLGYWKQSSDYTLSCEALADKLAESVELNHKSCVFDAGFGCGDQLLLWLQKYNVQSVSGINYSNSQTALAKKRLEKEGFYKTSCDIFQGDVSDLSDCSYFNKKLINTVLALDCAYHFPSRRQFLVDSFKLLKRYQNHFDLGVITETALHLEYPNDGQFQESTMIGLTDIVLASKKICWRKKILLKAMLKLSKIPIENIVSIKKYETQLRQIGFVDIKSQDISDCVFEPFGQFIKKEYDRRKQAGESVKEQRFAWLKYRITSAFLKWAYRAHVLRYVTIKASVPCGK